jgi:hypothetical protein
MGTALRDRRVGMALVALAVIAFVAGMAANGWLFLAVIVAPLLLVVGALVWRAGIVRQRGQTSPTVATK